jgi:hypothetical protein
VKNYVTGEDALISLAGPANKQGRIIADNICGGDSRYPGSQGSSVIKVFDMTAAATGINETTARKTGLHVDTVILSPMSHAGYYPGGKVMTMKVVFEKETYRLLGAQIVGYEGVDKRIDVLATAIHAGLKATQLKDLDLAYAPPYSSAKDPVNMAGFMIDNIAKGVLKQWHLEDAAKLPKMAALPCWTPGQRANINVAISNTSGIFLWMNCGSGSVKSSPESRFMSSVRAVCAAILPAGFWRATAMRRSIFRAASDFMMLWSMTAY